MILIKVGSSLNPSFCILSIFLTLFSGSRSLCESAERHMNAQEMETISFSLIPVWIRFYFLFKLLGENASLKTNPLILGGSGAPTKINPSLLQEFHIVSSLT